MKLLKLSVCLGFLALSTQVKSDDEVLMFQEPPSAQEILESFGEPVLKTRGMSKKTRMIFSNNPASVVMSGENSATPTKETTQPNTKKVKKSPIAFPLVFALNSAELSEDAKKYIDSMASALNKKSDLTIHISGHTDVSGSDEINKPLSLQRAAAVRNYLESVHRIDSARLEISGEGSDVLFDTANPYSATNRRVQFERK
jgi:outer membrane protein OmpA-like peptidoglycan-associated protein